MAPINSTKMPTAADFDVIQNRLAVALAKREQLIKSWTSSSSRPRPPPKTQEEIDAEDADLFDPSPPGHGLGAPIPGKYLDGDVKRREISSNDKLKHLLMGRKAGLQASKPRDIQERLGSAKRGLGEASSDEEEGRSGLGKAKKAKTGRFSSESAKGKLQENDVEEKIDQSLQPDRVEPVKLAEKNEHLFESKALGNKADKARPAQPHPCLQRPKNWNAAFKKPLVDYTSDDLEDEPIPTESAPKRTKISPAQDKGEDRKTSTSEFQNKSVAKILDKLTALNGPQKVSAQTNNAQQHSNTKPRLNPISGPTASSITSSGTLSSSDSDLSELEIVIPQGLNPSGSPSQSSPQLSTSRTSKKPVTADTTAKREKRRQKQVRKRERKLQQKAMELAAAANASTAKAGLSSTGNGEKQKLKDKLLDAHGNS